MAKEIIKVSGMHCKSCEMILEKKIKEIPGVTHVSAKTSRSEVRVIGEFDTKLVENAIIEAGYRVGLEEKSFLTRKPQVYLEIILSALILAILYVSFNSFGFAKIFPTVTGGNYSFGVVILLGMTAGFSTCMALIGGLVLGFTSKYKETHPEIKGFKSFVPNIYFNIGRIVGFFFLGGLLGEIGTVFKLSSYVNGWLLLLVSAVMLLLGLQLTEISPKISKINFTMPKFLSNFALFRSNKSGEYSHMGTALAGTLSFFLPCGFTQAVQLVAMSSGSFVTGALLMSLFALGTTPGLLLVGSVASFMKGKSATRVFRFIGVLVAILAFANITSAFNLIGFRFPEINIAAPTEITETQPLEVKDGVQIAKMDVVASGYLPNKFVVKKNVPVSWEINVKDISSCASYLVASELNIQQLLRRGETKFTFTPTEVGEIRFTCSMGMYTGKFTVVE